VGRRAPHRRLRTASWLAALLLVSGCVATGTTTPAATPLPAGTLGERLDAALAHDNEAAFVDCFSARHDASADGRQWFAVLEHGTSASVTQVDDHTLTVRSTEHGDTRAGTVTFTLDLDATGRIASVASSPHRPIWALGPTDITDATRGTLYTAGLDEAARRQWADRLDRAVAAVAAYDPPGAEDGADGLVVQLPADAGAFEAMTGEPSSSASAVSVCDTGTPRIVVNPVVLTQSAEWLDSTMVHEAVHVATGSPCRPSGQLAWAVEGLAESVAASGDPTAAARNRALVVAYLADHPVPDALPADLSDLTGYALAQVAVDQVRAHAGHDWRSLIDRASGDAGTLTRTELRRITGWYTAELRRLAASA